MNICKSGALCLRAPRFGGKCRADRRSAGAVGAVLGRSQGRSHCKARFSVLASAEPEKTPDEVGKFVKQTASTFAPRASGPTGKNPAYPGSALYSIFEVQAYLSILVGGLLAFNVIWPTDEPSIPRLIGMWSVWMFAVPSLRARDCSKNEKDALNILFLAIPLLNVTIPLLIKSFPVVFSADVALMGLLYYQKGAFSGGFSLVEAAADAPAAAESEAAPATKKEQ